MLQLFLVGFAIFIFSWISFVIIGIIVPVWRFMESADMAIELYRLLKEILKIYPQVEGKFEIGYGKCKIKFTNNDEAYIGIENVVNYALDCYDRLGWITVATNVLDDQKNELINICYELRRKRWQKARN